MSKDKFSDADTVRLGLLKNGEHAWEYTTFTPSWVYQYLLQSEIRDMGENPLATERCANWLRYKYPEEAVLLGLADSVEFRGWTRGVTSYAYLGLTGAQYRDNSGQNRIALDHPNCPPSMIEYAMVRFPHRIDYAGMSISSDVFIDEDFSEWVRVRDHRLAAMLRLGERLAVRSAETQVEQVFPRESP